VRRKIQRFGDCLALLLLRNLQCIKEMSYAIKIIFFGIEMDAIGTGRHIDSGREYQQWV
jgi:hypothetical protein